jgi:hypothetical protein
MEKRSVMSATHSHGELSMLHCPRCGEVGGLHLDSVVVGTADGTSVELHAVGEDEDADVNISVSARGRGASVAARAAHSQADNLRRHFIKIVGWCEMCSSGEDEDDPGQGDIGLFFQQHKGLTLFAMTSEPDSRPPRL